jgi:(p)ppGpp synthase/HD superfamily hydrolase
VRVAELLDGAGVDDETVVAGLLHDLLEDTEVSLDDLRERFGERVAGLVRALSEDESIGDYARRKEALRRQIAEAGRDAALIAMADKLARVEALRERTDRLPAERLHHYHETVRTLERRHGELPFAGRVRRALARMRQNERGGG